MKLPQALLVCFCLLGATRLAWGQMKEPAARAIPGYLDPATGKFTTRIASAATARPNPEAAVTGTSIFFREDFQVNIANYDQPGTTAVCSVSMTSGDANDFYDEEAVVAATPVGGAFFCDVPILTLWTLQTPASDTIIASVMVTIYSATTPIPLSRSSTQFLSLPQPAAGQTVVTVVNFQI